MIKQLVNKLYQGDQVHDPHAAHDPEQGFYTADAKIGEAEIKGKISLACHGRRIFRSEKVNHHSVEFFHEFFHFSPLNVWGLGTVFLVLLKK